MWILGLVLFAVAGLLGWLGQRSGAFAAKMDAMPTTPIGALARGYVEVKGVCSCDAPLQIPHVDREAVYYSYRVERRETDRDSDGRTRTTWRTIDSGSSETPFTLTDDSGAVTVDPTGAEHDAPQVFQGYIEPDFDLGGAGGLMGVLGGLASAAMARDRRITVEAIATGEELYILGTVRAREDGSRVIARGRDKFFISHRSEEELRSSYGSWQLGYYIGAGVCGVGGLICLFV